MPTPARTPGMVKLSFGWDNLPETARHAFRERGILWWRTDYEVLENMPDEALTHFASFIAYCSTIIRHRVKETESNLCWDNFWANLLKEVGNGN